MFKQSIGNKRKKKAETIQRENGPGKKVKFKF